MPSNAGVIVTDGQGVGTITDDDGADLVASLTDTPDPVDAGSNLGYTATTTNNGPGSAAAVSISLPLPAGTTLVSSTASSGGTCAGSTTVLCNWAAPTAIGAGNARSVVVIVAVAANATGSLNATATVATTSNDPGPGTNTATATTVVNSSADLSITLLDTPDPVVAGTELVYTATVTNGGPSDAQNVSATLPLPSGTSLVSANAAGGGVCTGTTTVQCTWSGATSPAATRVATITVLVSSAQTAALTATATAASNTNDPTAASATATTAVIQSANLSLALTSSATEATFNTPITFSATSTNLGPSDAQNLQISITLSSDLRFSSLSSSAGAVCTSPQIGLSGVITCTWAGATAANASRTLGVVAFSNSPGTSQVSASTVSATSDPVSTNNAAALSITVGASVLAIPSLSFSALALLSILLSLIGVVAIRRHI